MQLGISNVNFYLILTRNNSKPAINSELQCFQINEIKINANVLSYLFFH